MDSNENTEKLGFRERQQKERSTPEVLREDVDRLSRYVDLSKEMSEGALEEINKLKSEISKLESRIKTQRQEEKKLYIIPLVAVVTFVAFLVYRGWAEKPEVSIDFNVGEIIGGSLAGLGALIAGVTYAYRRTIRGE
jgi:hypothetical protein